MKKNLILLMLIIGLHFSYAQITRDDGFEIVKENYIAKNIYVQNTLILFNESTIISCYIPETIKKAELCIYDMSGSRLKCLTVTERGETNIQIQAGQLAAGVYAYLLIGDGKNSDAKQMILTK